MSERWWDVTNQRWAGGPDSRDTEIDRLRAELADSDERGDRNVNRAKDSEAAIAAVRELCNGTQFVHVALILRALEGGSG